MKELPLSVHDYENAALLGDFISKLRKAAEEANAEDVHFVPEINGYTVTYSMKDNSFRLLLKILNGFSSCRKLCVKVYCGGILSRTLYCFDIEENTKAVNKIFEK